MKEKGAKTKSILCTNKYF